MESNLGLVMTLTLVAGGSVLYTVISLFDACSSAVSRLFAARLHPPRRVAWSRKRDERGPRQTANNGRRNGANARSAPGKPQWGPLDLILQVAQVEPLPSFPLWELVLRYLRRARRPAGGESSSSAYHASPSSVRSNPLLTRRCFAAALFFRTWATTLLISLSRAISSM